MNNNNNKTTYENDEPNDKTRKSCIQSDGKMWINWQTSGQYSLRCDYLCLWHKRLPKLWAEHKLEHIIMIWTVLFWPANIDFNIERFWSIEPYFVGNRHLIDANNKSLFDEWYELNCFFSFPEDLLIWIAYFGTSRLTKNSMERKKSNVKVGIRCRCVLGWVQVVFLFEYSVNGTVNCLILCFVHFQLLKSFNRICRRN